MTIFNILNGANTSGFYTTYETSEQVEVELTLSDLSGKVIRSIIKMVEPGYHEDNELSNNTNLSPGIYLVRFREGAKPTTTTKVVVTR